MGFTELRAQKALAKTSNAGLEEAINWLSEHLEDADIDDPMEVSVKTQEELGEEAAKALAGGGAPCCYAAVKRRPCCGVRALLLCPCGGVRALLRLTCTSIHLPPSVLSQARPSVCRLHPTFLPTCSRRLVPAYGRGEEGQARRCAGQGAREKGRDDGRGGEAEGEGAP